MDLVNVNLISREPFIECDALFIDKRRGYMTLQRILLTYVISVPVFFVIDMIWLGVIARGFTAGPWNPC